MADPNEERTVAGSIDADCLTAGNIRRILSLVTPYLSFKEAFFHSTITGDIDDPLKHLHKHGMCRDSCIWDQQHASTIGVDEDDDRQTISGSITVCSDLDPDDLACRLFYDETMACRVQGYCTPPGKVGREPYLRSGDRGAASERCEDTAKHCPTTAWTAATGWTSIDDYDDTSVFGNLPSQTLPSGDPLGGSRLISGSDAARTEMLTRHIEMFMKILPSVDEYIGRSATEETLYGASSSSTNSFGDHLRNEAADLIIEKPNLQRTRPDDWLDIYEVEELLSVPKNGKYLGIVEFTQDIGEHIMAWTFSGRTGGDNIEPSLDLSQATTSCIKRSSNPQLFDGLRIYLDLMMFHAQQKRERRLSSMCSEVVAPAVGFNTEDTEDRSGFESHCHSEVDENLCLFTANYSGPAGSTRQEPAAEASKKPQPYCPSVPDSTSFLLSQVLTVDAEPGEVVTLKVWLAVSSSTVAQGLGRVALIKIDDL